MLHNQASMYVVACSSYELASTCDSQLSYDQLCLGFYKNFCFRIRPVQQWFPFNSNVEAQKCSSKCA